MIKYTDYSIVFQEIPDQITLAINISGCPNGCPGCHSPWLQEDIGQPLTEDVLATLLSKYKGAITCVCFMGGDAYPEEVVQLASLVRKETLLAAWYSGRNTFPENLQKESFDYIKIGPYVAELGPLSARTTNQRLFRVSRGGGLTDITSRFWR